jgi:hypothetical protein
MTPSCYHGPVLWEAVALGCYGNHRSFWEKSGMPTGTMLGDFRAAD